MARKKFRPAAWAVLVVIALSALMVSLGVWQLRRGFAKQEMLDRYAHAAQQPAQHIDAGKVAYDGQIERAYVKGHFDGSRQLLLDNQGYDGQPGYHVWTPFVQADGSTVVVDRGWIPRAAAQQPDRYVVAADERQLQGYWRSLPRPGLRLDADNCAAAPWPRVVQYPTVEDLHCLYGEFVAQGLLLMDADAPDGFVREWRTAPELRPAKHYGYAAQWFAFTLTLIAIFVKLSFRVPQPRPS
ncbi:SURF1 family protein [Solimonas flava]|uniref:SURF1 family protein n=1 Tax=Solimonas flava TaxID=415849 RepID=UPI0003F5D72C|nr:SURF1 family protein [Solimonas flava]